MEFGIHESLRIYSGGLGVLAGDHLKAASELGVPLVGVGLLYRARATSGRRSTPTAAQPERYPTHRPARLPVPPVRRRRRRARVDVELAGERDRGRASGACDVGSVPLYLLDADIASTPDAPLVTGSLYGGDRELRIRQEILLGIGGVRALPRSGIAPDRLPHERGPLRLPRARARCATLVAAGDAVRRGARARRAPRPSSPRTRRSRPATRPSTATRRRATSARSSRGRPRREERCWRSGARQAGKLRA